MAAAGAEGEPARYVGGVRSSTKPFEQCHLVLGFEAPSYREDDFFAAQVLSGLLGGGMSSRLFQEVRENRGLCYSIYSSAWGLSDKGMFSVHAATGADTLDALVAVVSDELKQVASAAPGAGEVARAKAQLKAGLLMSLESCYARAEQMSRQQLVWGRFIATEGVDRAGRCGVGRRPQRVGGAHHHAVEAIDRRGRRRPALGRGRGQHQPADGRLSGGSGDMAFLKSSLGTDLNLVVSGRGVWLRPPMMSDYAAWAELRAMSRDHLTPWEPQWARDELSRSAFPPASAPLRPREPRGPRLRLFHLPRRRGARDRRPHAQQRAPRRLAGRLARLLAGRAAHPAAAT